jgi:hypothetical protein
MSFHGVPRFLIGGSNPLELLGIASAVGVMYPGQTTELGVDLRLGGPLR